MYDIWNIEVPIFIAIICRTHTGHSIREESNGIPPFLKLSIRNIIGVDMYRYKIFSNSSFFFGSHSIRIPIHLIFKKINGRLWSHMIKRYMIYWYPSYVSINFTFLSEQYIYSTTSCVCIFIILK